MVKRMARAATLSFILILASACALAARTQAPRQWDVLVEMFDPTLKDDNVVGGSIALVEHGRIVARHFYGFSDRNTRKPVDADTIFHWASITKTLNAISVMQLRDRGLLTLDDRITHYLPELQRVHNAYGSMDAITLRMLMTHSAGFQTATWPYKQGRDWEPFEPTTWDQLVAMMPYQQIAFTPGTRFSYSNPGWIYLGRALELLTGDPWETYVQKNIFSPLGMSRSYFGSTPNYLRTSRSHRYSVQADKNGKSEIIDQGTDFDPGITIPNGGWNSPLADAAAYVAFLTNAGGGDSEQQRRYDAVLRRATLEEMWVPQLKVSEEADAGSIGLGYFLITQDRHRIVGHTGGQGDFTSFLYFDRDTGRGVIAAFNTVVSDAGGLDHHFFSKLREQALKVLADESR